MFTLIVGDICERFLWHYTGCSFSHALWTCHTVEVPDSVSIMLQTSRSF